MKEESDNDDLLSEENLDEDFDIDRIFDENRIEQLGSKCRT